MIFGLLFKNLKYIIDAAIIVAILVAFAYWDPFGLFGTKVETHDTANLVTNIREMGELITAEYYGEVVASWKEGKITQYSQDTITKLATDQYRKLKFALWEVYRNSKDFNKNNEIKVKKRTIEDLLVEVNPEFVKTMVYYDLLKYIAKQKYNVDEDKESDLLWLLYNEVADKIKDSEEFSTTVKYLNDTTKLNAPKFYTSFKSKIADDLFGSRNTRRKNIVFIGRGWVKAGFDFSKLNENNFFYDRDNASITFLGFEPKVLNADINPWFIPENRIKGFELVDYSGRVNFQDAILVKKKCKEKLRDQALGAGILESASNNGKTTLISFFSLVLGTEIKSVSFLTDRYEYLLAEIAQDGLVSLEEAMVVEKVYNEEIAAIEKDSINVLYEKKLNNLTSFLRELQRLHYLKKEYPFNYFSSLCSRIIGSSTGFARMDEDEWELLYSLRIKMQAQEDLRLPKILKHDSVWFSKAGAYMADFNNAIALLKMEIEEYDTLHSLADLKFDFRDILLRDDTSDISVICSVDRDIKNTQLLEIRETECRRIKEKIRADRKALKGEKEKMMGLPYKIGLLQKKIENHFNPEPKPR